MVAAYDHFPFPAPEGGYQVVPFIGNDRPLVAEEFAGYPAYGLLPTNAWPVNQLLREVTPLTVPAGLPPGVYQLYVGLYNPETLDRLPVIARSREQLSKDNSIWLTSVEILN